MMQLLGRLHHFLLSCWKLLQDSNPFWLYAITGLAGRTLTKA